MESVEPKANSQWWDSHISPENLKWLAENLEGIDQSVKELLKLIEEDRGQDRGSDKTPENKRPEVIKHIVEFSRMHQVLAERYDHLIGEVRRNCATQIKHSDISEFASPQPSLYLTPAPERSMDKSKQSGNYDFYLSSGGGSYDISPRDGNETSLSLSSDSDSDLFNSVNKLLISPVNKVSTANERATGDYEALLKRMSDYEEELMLANKRVHTLAEENASLKSELKKNEDVIVLKSSLQAQLESAQQDMTVQNAKIRTMGMELEMTRQKLMCSEEESANLKLELSNVISESTSQLQGQFELALRDIALLQRELDSEKNNFLEMNEKLVRYEADISERDHEIRELNAALHETKEKSCVEKIQLESEIKQLKSDNLMMRSLYEAKEDSWQAEVDRLNADFRQKCELVEGLNKALDMLNLKNDMLMTEKDGANAHLDTLKAELRSRDNLMQQMEDNLRNLQSEHNGIMDSSQRLTNELRQKVEELEKEVEWQREVISDRAEEKREAIRQLCFSLEHYRTGYKELREAFIGHKQQVILAS